MKFIAIFFETNKGKYLKNLIIGLGASVVLIGALGKITHASWGNWMLTIGMLTEAFLFALLGILPPHKDYYWEKLYPGLDENPEIDSYKKGGKHLVPNTNGGANTSVTQSLDKMLTEAQIDQNNIKKLGESFQKFGQTVSDIKEISNVTVATNEFSSSAKEAASVLGEMKNTFASASSSMQSFNNAADDTMKFHQQVQVLSKNLTNLNSIYEVELNDANNHLKAMNKFYSNLVNASESMAASAEDAQNARQQISTLANNLSSLNAIYGNMLSAMQGRA